LTPPLLYLILRAKRNRTVLSSWETYAFCKGGRNALAGNNHRVAPPLAPMAANLQTQDASGLLRRRNGPRLAHNHHWHSCKRRRGRWGEAGIGNSGASKPHSRRGRAGPSLGHCGGSWREARNPRGALARADSGTHGANPFNFKLSDAEDFAYEVTFGGPEPAVHAVDLGSGEKTRGWVAFEVNAGTPLKRLKYDPNPFTTNDIEFQFQ